jgi:hypothetical protein
VDIICIEDPRDWSYPFAQWLYDNPCVVYHGTSSAYASVIEREGFMVGHLPFSVKMLQHLIAVCAQLGFRSWSYTTVRGLSSGTKLSRDADRPVYFSANFWFARDYATNIGGETIHNALRLSKEMLDHLARIGKGTSTLGDEVRDLQHQLLALTADSFPVVYAVRIDREWIEDETQLERGEKGSLVPTAVNIACTTSVPSDRLQAKVEYINGAESGYLGPQPTAWAETRHLGRT